MAPHALAPFLFAGGLLLGSIPTGLLIGKAKGVDIRTTGSGNIGATNLGRVLGKKYFLLCFALDAAKGLAPPLVFGLWAGLVGRFDLPITDSLWWLAIMAAPILGHMYSPWVKFKGGKGVATGLGASLGVAPIMTFAGIGALIVWLTVFFSRRIVSLASIIAAAALPVLVVGIFAAAAAMGRFTGPNHLAVPYVALAVLLGALVIIRHRSNIARLRAGTEPRFTPK